MTLRLLRSAEWQIGRIYAQFEPDDASAPFEARFKAVERLAARAARHAVDAALVAGDVFDPQTVSDKTARRAFNAMQAYAGCRATLDGEPHRALADSSACRSARKWLEGGKRQPVRSSRRFSDHVASAHRGGEATPPNGAASVVVCPECRQRLRVPSGRVLNVTCVNCRRVFRTQS